MAKHQRSFTDRFYEGGGMRLSRLGSKLGMEWLVYNPLVFQHFHRLAREAAPGVVDHVTALIPGLKTVADIGCGSGGFAAEFARRGLKVSACEYNPKGRRIARRQGLVCEPFDLTNSPATSLQGPFDLAYCFEVAEHLPPELGDRLVRLLIDLSPHRVLFSAAQPGQGGHGHINEQPPAYWEERFACHGMRLQTQLTTEYRTRLQAENSRSSWLARNSMFFAPG